MNLENVSSLYRLMFSICLFYVCTIHTFTVSKGWPEATRHIPPNPPAKKSLVGEVFFSGILNHVSKCLHKNTVDKYNEIKGWQIFPVLDCQHNCLKARSEGQMTFDVLL